MINKRLAWCLGKEKKIEDTQFGFKKQKSTVDAISKIKAVIFGGFRMKNDCSFF